MSMKLDDDEIMMVCKKFLMGKEGGARLEHVLDNSMCLKSLNNTEMKMSNVSRFSPV